MNAYSGSPEPPERANLRGFPKKAVPHGTLFRIHEPKWHPAYFGSKGDKRFDPPWGFRTEYGTCYVAENQEGAFLETFGRSGQFVARHLVDEHVISELNTASPLLSADLNAPKAIQFQVAADLSGGADYTRPQQWGKLLRDNGYKAVRYSASHDPSHAEICFALFANPPGEHHEVIDYVRSLSPPPASMPISQQLQDQIQTRWGITVLDADRLPD
ncbi:RES family NAD+ phosphorylase [Streptomyces sp. NPDC002659]|uniref:RES family NAD+ phosphorylase n=1 Tax=Streptomyces sp. NPDC002659 TaxID=3364656 RepID=UPI0036CB813D